MKMIPFCYSVKSFFSLLFFLIFFLACSQHAYHFRKSAQGSYRLADSDQQFTIDVTGSIAGTPETRLLFFQALSDHDAIYIQRKNNTNSYIALRLDGKKLYYAEGKDHPQKVSFDNLILFAHKIS